MLYLAGLTELQYVFYYPETKDIVIAGPAEGMMLDGLNRPVGIVTGQAVLQLEDLLACDGIAIGSPEYFGYMAGMIKDFFDRTYEPAKDNPRIFKKPYALFISAGNDGRNTRTQIERICLGFSFKKAYEPLIVRGVPDEESLRQCRELGQTIAAGCDLGIY